MSFASAESDFASGAVVGDVPKSQLRIEAEERIMNSYSFSSPESDFLSMSLPEADQMNDYKVGKGLSFVSAESDFCAGFSMPEKVKSELEIEAEKSIQETYSFASAESDFLSMEMPVSEQLEIPPQIEMSLSSPESDFTMGARAPVSESLQELQREAYASIAETYSFSSPESDFQSMYAPSMDSSLPEQNQASISFASPESDLQAGVQMPPETYERSALQLEAEAKIDETYSYSGAESDFTTMEVPSIYQDEVMVPASLSFASPESDFVGSVAAAHGAIDMGLGVSRKTHPAYGLKQPRMSYKEAITSTHTEPRVITEAYAPFKIVHANEAWKEVYEKNEGILGHTLAMANLKALGRDEVQSVPTKLGTSLLKVQPIEGKYLLNVLDGYKKEVKNTSTTQHQNEKNKGD